MEATKQEMDEASALIAWGRQVLVNRRLQKQRERMQREMSHDSDAVQHLNAIGARHSAMSEASSACDRDGVVSPHRHEKSMAKENRVQQPLERHVGHDGVASKRIESHPRASIFRQDAVEASQLQRRVEVAKQTLQELSELDVHNDKVFWQHMQELQSMLEQVELQKEPLRHVTRLSFGKNAVRESTCGSATTASTPRQKNGHEQKLSRKEQLEELWSLQKALLKSLQDEKFGGVAVASLATCASDVPNWDDRLWCVLRQAIHDWKLRLVPSLHHFLNLVQELPMLQQEEDKKIGLRRPLPQSSEHAVAMEASIIPLTSQVMLPEEKNYPALECLDKLPLQEAIGVVIDVLARAGMETETSLASIIKLSDEKDVQLFNLLEEAEGQLKQQEDMLEQAQELIGTLQREKMSLEEDGAALHDAVEVLQEKVVSLRAQHEERQREETEVAAELQKHKARLYELKQCLEREASLRNDAVKRTEEAKRSAEDAARQTTLLQDELQREKERQKSVEEEVLQLQRLLRVAKEEEEDATTRRKWQSDELRVAQSALQKSKEAFLRQKQQHEAEQKTFVSLRCSEQEVLGQITTEEEACKECAKELGTQRGIEAAMREELATLHAELLEAQKEKAAVQRSLQIMNEKLEAAKTALLRDEEMPGTIKETPPPATAATTTLVSSSASLSSPQRNLVEVLHPKSSNSKNDKSPAPLHVQLNKSPDSKVASLRHKKMSQLSKQENQHGTTMTPVQPHSNAAEVTITPKGLQRQQEEVRLEQSHLHVGNLQRKQEEKQQQQKDDDGDHDEVVPSATARSRNPSLLSPGVGSGQFVPLVVSLPSRQSGPSRPANTSGQ
ncbi:hypothetical protein TcCL_ESM06006 [Trypanosoma cruzi]|uniref:Uncharacterized protein n=1 Tax=Trypanosoma cruzi (strain CL Brener) TaxID=353153 RepID=Q4DAD3_TRYCC|nr:hypothetical protein Tc00.1047053508989.80 [Trypanosoma cruzi]EAN89486.1 hypothetical protein Tc00.1047053508989.80 [Trypanosoma cruzi]RNC56429.1 hypothetical protein TcCL_ESM06006 [Trypanosoma cruzi]|eukprot:XP_811337.1 hypothetical protein [Trypanosoma cruzi strain CL Brener]